ncbi:hypothetical protein F7731_10435 [Cytobacillus depressus]|uniref:YhfM-like domain-containing protein n=1 Tax=Cytobacillus depressus TaxID=1602942 RepID=A0A6L3V8L0_9BACI|nr:hypothetical protein [Cytobacillus depressus]KAB2336761.1 hypothetical protein F7731_10435 [Cytobacillus depressus]
MKSKLGITVLLLLFISACSFQKVDNVNIYEMKSFSDFKENSLVVISDSKEKNVIIKAFTNAARESGIVNMADPHYKVEIGNEAFFLWIGDNSGTIMNLNDTHTIYTLSEKASNQIKKIIEDKK